VTVVSEHDRVADGQAETNTGYNGVRPVAAPEKWLKDLLAVCRRDTRTSILYDELQLVLRCHAGRDVNRSVRRCVFECVLQQIRQDPLHLAHVDAGEWQVRRNVSAYDPVANQAAYPVHGAVDHVGRACVGHVCLDQSQPIDAAGGQQGLDQLGHAIGLELNLRQHVLTGLRVPLHVVAPQGADEALDVAQR
jgi:hypothetical protein